MMAPPLELDPSPITILNGDCRAMLRTLPETSIQCCVTSPPYFGLRDYKVEGQIGLEPTPDEYVREMVAVFREVRRVLKDDGVLWLNLGDSYAGYHGNKNHAIPSSATNGWTNGTNENMRTSTAGRNGLKQKDLIMIPARVAMALQSDGWYLRAACPWIKRNGMPDSTSDRPTQCIEYLFMLTKNKGCYYDAEAVKKPARTGANGSRFDSGKTAERQLNRSSDKPREDRSTRLRRSSDWFFESWQGLLLDGDDEPSSFVVNTKGYKEAHFATFPPKLVEPCVLATTSEKGECPECGKAWEREKDHTPMVIDRSQRTHELGRTRSSGTMVSPARTITTGWRPACDCGHTPVPQTILDPFAGSGTTGEVALAHGRHAVLIELNPDYAGLIRKRCGIPHA